MKKILTTSKGFEFERISDGVFKDLTTGMVWGPVAKGRYNHYESDKNFGDRLPTKEEFEIAESHGFREVLGITKDLFWSSSVYPFNSDDAYYFNGFSGGVDNYYRDSYYGSVLCVKR